MIYVFDTGAFIVPNVGQHFGVPCLNLEAFMAQQGWTF